jgi:hypothetical protein
MFAFDGTGNEQSFGPVSSERPTDFTVLFEQR